MAVRRLEAGMLLANNSVKQFLENLSTQQAHLSRKPYHTNNTHTPIYEQPQRRHRGTVLGTYVIRLLVAGDQAGAAATVVDRRLNTLVERHAVRSHLVVQSLVHLKHRDVMLVHLQRRDVMLVHLRHRDAMLVHLQLHDDISYIYNATTLSRKSTKL